MVCCGRWRHPQPLSATAGYLAGWPWPSAVLAAINGSLSTGNGCLWPAENNENGLMAIINGWLCPANGAGG